MAPMTTDHREAALAALDRAESHRTNAAKEYAKPVGLRDYDRISDQRHAAKVALAEAHVHALLAPQAVVVVDNTHDALQAVRTLSRPTA